MRNLVTGTLALALLALPVHAEPNIKAANEVQSEFSQCAAYYAFAAHCLGAPKDELGARIKRFSDDFILGAVIFGKGMGMSEDAIEARYSLHWDGINEMTGGGKCINQSVAIKRYFKKCKEISEDQEGYFKRMIEANK